MTSCPPTLPSGYRLEACADLPRALDRVWQRGLLEDDETTSRVLPLACPRNNPARAGITHAWFVVEQRTGLDVGMALLSRPTPDTCGRRELNLFVDAAHRARGLGECLLHAARQSDSSAVGYYSNGSVKLYAKHQLGCAWPPPVDAQGRSIAPGELSHHLGPDNLAPNQRLHVDWMLAERNRYDELDRQFRDRKRSCHGARP